MDHPLNVLLFIKIFFHHNLIKLDDLIISVFPYYSHCKSSEATSPCQSFSHLWKGVDGSPTNNPHTSRCKKILACQMAKIVGTQITSESSPHKVALLEQ